MRRLKFVLAGLVIGSPALALAQDAPADPNADPNAGGGAEVGGEVSTGGTEGTPAVDGAATVSAAGWSKSAIERPYFRSAGKIDVGGDFNLLKVSFPGAMGMSNSLTVDWLTLGGSYAVTDQISAGAVYALSLGLGDGDFEAAGPLSLWGGYQIKHDAKMSVAATAAFAVDLQDPGMGDRYMGIGAGLGLRYTVADKIAVFTGGPHGPGPVGGAGFGGGLLSSMFGATHLNISLVTDGPITFDLPVGAMFQATPELAIHLMTTLASIGISNSPYVDDMGMEKSAMIFGADYIPLSVGGLFAVNDMIDAAVGLALPDLKEAQFDLYVISLGARAHL